MSKCDLDQLSRPYSTILCDIWGVIHDGGRLLPGAADRLARYKDQGKTVILITNAPRPAERVEEGLALLGLPRSSFDAVTSSGAAGIAALRRLGAGVGFIGTREDRADLEAHGVVLADAGFGHAAVTGFDEARDDPEEYLGQLGHFLDDGVILHCLNPDRVVIHRGRREPCAGALADLYEAQGGTVRWYGKPHAPIYDHALTLAGNPDRASVLAIGDGLVTDMLGAACFGIDALFVAGGIHAGERFPEEFAAKHGLGDWRPVATVADLS